jgi:hypothetical protein
MPKCRHEQTWSCTFGEYKTRWCQRCGAVRMKRKGFRWVYPRTTLLGREPFSRTHKRATSGSEQASGSGEGP